MRMRMAACGLRVPVSLHGMFLRVHPSLRLLLEVWMKIRVQGCRDACPALRMAHTFVKQGLELVVNSILLLVCHGSTEPGAVPFFQLHVAVLCSLERARAGACCCTGAWVAQAQLEVALRSLTLKAGSHTSSSMPDAPTHAHEQADTSAHGCASERA